VESQKGTGSTFIFSIPFQDQAEVKGEVAKA
jgi:hypothetical protein